MASWFSGSEVQTNNLLIMRPTQWLGRGFCQMGHFFDDFEIFNGPFLIILHRLLWAIFQVNGTMAHMAPYLPNHCLHTTIYATQMATCVCLSAVSLDYHICNFFWSTSGFLCVPGLVRWNINVWIIIIIAPESSSVDKSFNLTFHTLIDCCNLILVAASDTCWQISQGIGRSLKELIQGRSKIALGKYRK